MRILSQHMTQSSSVLPLQCECGQTILYRVVDPDIDAHCPRCGVTRTAKRLVTDLLLEENPDLYLVDPDLLDYESLEIQGD